MHVVGMILIFFGVAVSVYGKYSEYTECVIADVFETSPHNGPICWQSPFQSAIERIGEA